MSKRINPSLTLREFIPYQLSVVTNKISAAFAALYSTQFGLSIHEWRVMAVLGEQPGLSAEQVCVETEMGKVPVSRAVAKLTEKNLVDRAVSLADKRRSVLRLTKTGNTRYRQIVPLALQFERALEQALTKQELKQFDHCLAKLHDYANNLS